MVAHHASPIAISRDVAYGIFSNIIELIIISDNYQISSLKYELSN